MSKHVSASKSSHRKQSEYPEAEDTYYSSATPSSSPSYEDTSTSATPSRPSTRLSRIVSMFDYFKKSKDDQSGPSPSSRSNEHPASKDVGQPPTILNSILTGIHDALSYLWKAVKELFPKHDTRQPRKRRLMFQSDNTDPVIAEIHAFRDKIYWKRDNKTSVFKRNPEKCTVFEIKQDGGSDKEQRQKQKSRLPKSKEIIPLGTTVYRQPARGMCIGSEQISGSVKVVLDYTGKRAFVQLISRKSEVYATYTVNSITFLVTCTPFGVAWIGDTFKPEASVPGPEKKPQHSSPSEQAKSFDAEQNQSIDREKNQSFDREKNQSFDREKNQSLDTEKNQNNPRVERVDSNIQTDPEEYSESESGTGVQNLSFETSPAISFIGSVHEDGAPSKGKSQLAGLESNESSTSYEINRAESKLLKNVLVDEHKKDDPPKANNPAKKQVSSSGSGSGVSNSEEEILIDVVHVVFSNPTQVQRLKHIVTTLKGALGCGAFPESGTFLGSNSSCGSSSEVSSRTVDLSSTMSNDLNSEISQPRGYCIFPSNNPYFEGSCSIPQRVTRSADVAQRLYYHSTESPQQAFYRDNGSSHQNQQQHEAGKILHNEKAVNVQEQQNGKQVTTNDVSQIPAVKPQAKPGLSNNAQKVVQNPYLQNDQNQIPSKRQQENNYSLQKQNVAYEQLQNVAYEQKQNVAYEQKQNVAYEQQQNVAYEQEQNVAYEQKQQTGFQDLHQAKTQQVVVSQNPRPELNTMPYIYTIQSHPQEAYQVPDPRLTSHYNLWTFGNQMPGTDGNQFPSTSDGQITIRLGKKVPRPLRKDNLSVVKSFGIGSSQNKKVRIYRHVNPSSIRRQWSISHAAPSNKVQVCWVSDK